MKKIFVSFLVIFSMFSTIVYAGNLVKKVYFSPYPILINGKEYSSEMPILQYQGRTYVALREFSEMVDVKVDFVNDVIIIENKKEVEKKSENVGENIKNEIQKESEVSEKDKVVESEGNKISNSNTKIVYVSKSGKKYHKIANCNSAKYFEITLSDAIKDGYTPCLRCANLN